MQMEQSSILFRRIARRISLFAIGILNVLSIAIFLLPVTFSPVWFLCVGILTLSFALINFAIPFFAAINKYPVGGIPQAIFLFFMESAPISIYLALPACLFALAILLLQPILLAIGLLCISCCTFLTYIATVFLIFDRNYNFQYKARGLFHLVLWGSAFLGTLIITALSLIPNMLTLPPVPVILLISLLLVFVFKSNFCAVYRIKEENPGQEVSTDICCYLDMMQSAIASGSLYVADSGEFPVRELYASVFEDDETVEQNQHVCFYSWA